MIKLIKTASLIIISVVCFLACDYVSSPYKQQPGIVTSTDTSKVYKNVLVEDYTGITCGNCPGAADVLDSMIKKYGSRIVPMAVNAGSFASPPLAPSQYNIDFTSPTGDAYNTFFGISSNPNGMVNRKGYPLTNVQTDGAWDGLAYNIIQNDTAFIKLTLNTTFDTTSRNLSVTATSKFLKALSGKYYLVVLLTQDSIMAPQLKYGAPNSQIVNYAHRYALRDAINSTWGDSLVSNGAALNKIVIKTYNNYNIKATYGAATSSHGPIPCNFKQCYVVAYVYNGTTYEVLQSMQKKIYP
jgi:hypothetical protein